jgi:hypothetical protein
MAPASHCGQLIGKQIQAQSSNSKHSIVHKKTRKSTTDALCFKHSLGFS